MGIKNQQGSILLTVMAVSVVAAILALGFGTLFTDSYRQAKASERKVAVSELGSEIKNLFASPNLCKCNFQSITFPTSGTQLGDVSITNLKYYKDSACATAVNSAFLTVGSAIPADSQLKVSSMTLKNPAIMPGSAVSADLEIKFDSTSMFSAPPRPLIVPNMMFVVTPTNQVTDCIGVDSVQPDRGAATVYDPPSMCGPDTTSGHGYPQFCWNGKKVAFTNGTVNPLAATLVSAGTDTFEIMFATASGRNVLLKLQDMGTYFNVIPETGWKRQLCYAHNHPPCEYQNFYGTLQFNCSNAIFWNGTGGFSSGNTTAYATSCP